MEVIHAIADLEGSKLDVSKEKKLELYTQLYTKLLSTYPWLEGFWIRYAHTTFSLTNCDAAVSIFEQALKVPFMNYSVKLWVEYLRFMVHLKCTARPVPNDVIALFERAAETIGTVDSHFLAHEFWLLYLEVCPNQLVLLQRIITSTTLHQVTTFYKRMRSQISESGFDELNKLLPENERIAAPSSEQEKKEELTRFREVLCTKLHFQYELHTRRVKSVYTYEQLIKRPFFYPKQVTKHDYDAWIAYIVSITNNEHKLATFKRALIPLALNENMWMMYIRYIISQRSTDLEIEEAFRAGKHLDAVNKLHDVWTKPVEVEDELTQLRRTNAAAFLNRFKNMEFSELEDLSL